MSKALSMPTFQPIADIASFEIDPSQLHTTPTESCLPVYVSDHRLDDDGETVLHASAWSAGMEVPYQKTRIETLARALGLRILAPNSPGQAIGSPELTSEERAELKAGRAHLLGAKVVQAAFEAAGDVPESVHVTAVSQGPVLVPGMLAELRERNVDVKSVSLFTPASVRSSTLGLFKDMLFGAAKFMKDYRKQNPEYLQGTKDTNIAHSMRTQFRAHVIDYPRGMARQDLAGQLSAEINASENKPRVEVFAAEHDKVSRLKANTKFVEELRSNGIDATLEVLQGQYHAVTEHVGYMASLLKRVIAR